MQAASKEEGEIVMSLDQLVYDHRKLMWIRERRRFLTPSPPSPKLLEGDRPLSLLTALERISDDVDYVEDLMQVHRHDLEEVLTNEEWQVMQASISRFRASFQASRRAAEAVSPDAGEVLGRLLTDAAVVAEIDGFINGLIYESVRELNLSPTGPQTSIIEYARGNLEGRASLPGLPEPSLS